MYFMCLVPLSLLTSIFFHWYVNLQKSLDSPLLLKALHLLSSCFLLKGQAMRMGMYCPLAFVADCCPSAIMQTQPENRTTMTQEWLKCYLRNRRKDFSMLERRLTPAKVESLTWVLFIWMTVAASVREMEAGLGSLLAVCGMSPG